MRNTNEKEQEHPDIAYEIAKQNTSQNENGIPIISKDDEWIDETEWDVLFKKIKDSLSPFLNG